MTEKKDTRTIEDFDRIYVMAYTMQAVHEFCRVNQIDFRKVVYLSEIYKAMGLRGVPYVRIHKWYMHKDAVKIRNIASLNGWEEITHLFQT